jgi:hypothetical protein
MSGHLQTRGLDLEESYPDQNITAGYTTQALNIPHRSVYSSSLPHPMSSITLMLPLWPPGFLRVTAVVFQ